MMVLVTSACAHKPRVNREIGCRRTILKLQLEKATYLINVKGNHDYTQFTV
jgi:hypothetical protein